MYGLACDNVESYELVTASGVIINVSKANYPDLYWALRGGGNNFGIVTQFNVASIPRGPKMWGGMRAYLQPEFGALVNAFYSLGMSAKKDGKAHQILSFAWANMQIAQVELEYADPIANASVLAEYNAISNAVSDGTGIRSLAELTSLLATSTVGADLRRGFWTWSNQLDKDVAAITKDIFFEELPAVVDAEGLIPALSLQVLTEPILEKTAANGGNPLGLDAKNGPIMNSLLAVQWKNRADDDRINKFAAKVMERALAVVKARGKTNQYLYMNYASPFQDVVASYGAGNKAKLKAISKKYDPQRVFEVLQPGFFKLDGAPRGA